MLTNYHTHTVRCFHARGSEEDYIKTAIAAGFDELGFSDHAPYVFPDSYYSDYRMFPQDYKDYVTTLKALRKKYSDKIKIYIGLELEYYPECFNDEMKFLLTEDLDYLILGQHFTNNEYDGVYVASRSFADNEATLKLYVNQSIEAMRTGVFSYFAHPDIIRYTKADKTFTQEITKLCKEAKALNLPLEFNLFGLSDGRHYPNMRFWEIAALVGNEVIIGFDSHSTDAVYSAEREQVYYKALKIIDELGLKRVEKLKMIKPFIR